MNENVVRFYPKLNSLNISQSTEKRLSLEQDISAGTGTCTDAETFALRVGDASMEPEFAEGCVIIIDPTALATDGTYVLADLSKVPEVTWDQSRGLTDTEIEHIDEEGEYIFRQLLKTADGWALNPLNPEYRQRYIGDALSESIVGVIVQRAGKRRSYHKHYDIK